MCATKKGETVRYRRHRAHTNTHTHDRYHLPLAKRLDSKSTLHVRDALSNAPVSNVSNMSCSGSGEWIDAIDCHHRRRCAAAAATHVKRSTIATISRARSRAEAPPLHSIALPCAIYYVFMCGVCGVRAQSSTPHTQTHIHGLSNAPWDGVGAKRSSG